MARAKTAKSKSKYYGVSYLDARTGSASQIRNHDAKPWRARIDSGGVFIQQWFATEHEAARAVDLALIQNGKAPRNVLVGRNYGKFVFA